MQCTRPYLPFTSRSGGYVVNPAITTQAGKGATVLEILASSPLITRLRRWMLYISSPHLQTPWDGITVGNQRTDCRNSNRPHEHRMVI